MNRNRILVFFAALVVLGGLGFVVIKMFETEGGPKGPIESGGPAKAAPTGAPVAEKPPAPIAAKSAEGPTINPKSVDEPPVYAQDAGLGGVDRIGRIREDRHPADVGNRLLEQLELLADLVQTNAIRQSGDICTRAREP